MINSDQLRLEIVRPTLEYLDGFIHYSAAAENLLMGTCAQESNLGQYVKQLGDGPGCGIFQMEPATEHDIDVNYLAFRPELRDLVKWCCRSHSGNALISNLSYATAMARVHYYRVPEPIPMSDDIEGLAQYWKTYYNTHKGAGTTSEFIHNYKKYVE